jgi:hypothetical protein
MSAIPHLQTVSINPAEFSDDFPLAASTVLNATGGRFVTQNGSGQYALTTGASTQIDGWVDSPIYKVVHDGTQGQTPFTSSATAGLDVGKGTKDIRTSRFSKWVPIIAGATVTDDIIDKICDLDVTANLQTVNPAVTTRGHVKIDDLDIPGNMALVHVVLLA